MFLQRCLRHKPSQCLPFYRKFSTKYKHRVVVTGLGAVTCLGSRVESLWTRLLNGDVGISKLSGDEWKEFPCRIAGVIPPDVCLNDKFDQSERRLLSLPTQYALMAADEAIGDAGLTGSKHSPTSGVCVGMGMTVFNDVLDGWKSLEKGYRHVSPFFIPRALSNMPAGHISIRYGLTGPCLCPTTACTTGLHAIGDSFRLVATGYADMMVAGSTEAPVNPLSIAGFCRLKALATGYNESPEIASRPFDKDRTGFVMSEGAGMMVLEPLERALDRGARIYAEILGYGASADANHITAPSSDGDGAFRCMASALEDSGVSSDDVKYVNAHATSTPLGDSIELNAISRVFESSSSDLKVSSIKGAVGHLLGAAGSVEAAVTALACLYGTAPPNVNLNSPPMDSKFDLCVNKACNWGEEGKRRIAVSNSFGFGGTNASVCIAEYVP